MYLMSAKASEHRQIIGGGGGGGDVCGTFHMDLHFEDKYGYGLEGNGAAWREAGAGGVGPGRGGPGRDRRERAGHSMQLMFRLGHSDAVERKVG